MNISEILQLSENIEYFLRPEFFASLFLPRIGKTYDLEERLKEKFL